MQEVLERKSIKNIDFNCDLAQAYGIYKNNIKTLFNNKIIKQIIDNFSQIKNIEQLKPLTSSLKKLDGNINLTSIITNNNINAQMNYWPSGIANLSECFLHKCTKIK